MKKTIFAVLAFAIVAIFSACDNDMNKESEIDVEVNDITDTTAVVECVFTPVKSVTYTVAVDSVVSEEYDDDMVFDLGGLNPGTKYNVVVRTYDKDHKVVENKVVPFMTTGEIDNRPPGISKRRIAARR